MGRLDDDGDAVVVAVAEPVEGHEGSVGGEDRLNISPKPGEIYGYLEFGSSC